VQAALCSSMHKTSATEPWGLHQRVKTLHSTIQGLLLQPSSGAHYEVHSHANLGTA
jgi:hypothetical protein